MKRITVIKEKYCKLFVVCYFKQHPFSIQLSGYGISVAQLNIFMKGRTVASIRSQVLGIYLKSHLEKPESKKLLFRTCYDIVLQHICLNKELI